MPTLEGVWRDQWGRLLALLVAQYRRLDLAEDGLADAFEAAARHWPEEGPPANPPAWLLTAARRRIVDRLRAEAVAVRKEPLLIVDETLRRNAAKVMADPGDVIRDDQLRLIFLCAHPSLRAESAAALTLRLVLGVPTPDIARLFLVSESTMAARLTRAKRRLAATGAPFVLPSGSARADRLETVCSVIYLVFTSGYAPTSGADVTRVEVAGEAIRLARTLRTLLKGSGLGGSGPTRPPVLVDVLLALMVLQHSRRDARTADDGSAVLLPDQDRSRWHQDEIAEALRLLAPALAESQTGPTREYLLQALVGAEHSVAAAAPDTRWDRIAEHYAELEQLTRSPVVRLNRAVAVAEADGPAAGLSLLVGLESELPGSHRLPAVKGELLARSGDTEAALQEFDLAIEWCSNSTERSHLQRRRRQLSEDG